MRIAVGVALDTQKELIGSKQKSGFIYEYDGLRLGKIRNIQKIELESDAIKLESQQDVLQIWERCQVSQYLTEQTQIENVNHQQGKIGQQLTDMKTFIYHALTTLPEF